MILPLAMTGLLLLGTPARAADAYTSDELKSLYYADLGPSEIDVSAYPKKQQEGYALFRQVCSRCHTIARAVNSPTISEGAWEFYVLKMRIRGKFSKGMGYTPEEGRTIVDFMAYDSHQRKVKGQEEFEVLTRKLQNRFGQTIEERMRRLQETNKHVVPRR